MDSGNSGSMQSSSGGDEDYDTSSGGGGVAADHSPFQMPSFSSAATADFFAGETNLSSSTSYLNFVDNIIIPPFPNLPSSSHLHIDPEAPPILNQSRTIPPPSKSATATATKNPKKRTRASRRAPTTVLTTDTTNFRAMVQEFTGVPSPPFSTSHSYSSSLRRFDLFRSPPPPPQQPQSSSSSSGHVNLDSFSNPFRSTLQKVQTLIPSSSSSIMNHHQITADSSNIAASMASPTMNLIHPLPDLPLPKLPPDTHNTPVPTLQSLLSQQQHQHQHHQSVSSLHELNAMNLGALRQEHDHLHRLMIRRQFDVLPETANNVSSSSASIKGTTNTTTVSDPWISPTD